MSIIANSSSTAVLAREQVAVFKLAGGTGVEVCIHDIQSVAWSRWRSKVRRFYYDN